jgi:hypothetical protein
MSTLILGLTVDTSVEMPVSAWLMLAFGCVFLYGGLLYGIVRAIRGKLEIPPAVAEKAADAGWLVALSTLLIVAAIGYSVDPTGGHPRNPADPGVHVLVWVAIYLVVCVPLAILCRHLIILQYRWRKARHEPPEA